MITIKNLFLPAIIGTFLAGAAMANITEAEFSPGNSSIKAESEARGGNYTTAKGWNPLFVGNLPPEGDTFTVWARFRGTRLCLKSVDESGAQTELKWIFKSPETWTWESFGTFTRAQLGERFLIIRNPEGAENAGLDAVAVSPVPDFDPNDPDKKLAPANERKQGEADAELAVVKGPAGQEDKDEPTAISPAVVMLKAGGTQQFQLPAGAAGPVAWSVYDAKFQKSATAGSVDGSGLYTAPAMPGAYYVRAASDSGQSSMAAVIVANAESQLLFTDDFNADNAIALTDDNKNGVPDYTESGDDKKAAKPSPKNANAGSGLKETQAMVVASGPGGGVTRVDVVSGIAGLFPGGFDSNGLLLADEANWAMGFGVRFGDPCIRGELVFKFFDAGTKGNGLFVELGDTGVEKDPRTSAGSMISLLLKGGTLRFGDTNAIYEPGRGHTVKVRFDQTDTSAGPDGTYSVEIDGAHTGKAAFAKGGAPDRLSFHTAGAANMTKGMFFLDDISVEGIQAPVAARVAASTVQVDVDWSKVSSKTNRNSYSLNAFKGFNPGDSNDPKYQENISYMNPGLLRFHSWRMLDDSAQKPDGWVKLAEKQWDAEKIRSTMDGWASFYKGDILMNIPGWPEWFKRQGKAALDPSEYDNYANFCADLVKIINVDQKRGVKYWEITNEQDGTYWVDPKKNKEADNLPALVTIYNKCAEAMKKVDPTIQTGGPAVAKGDEFGKFREFIRGTKANLDFFSYHAYVSGSPSDPDKVVYDKAALATSFGAEIRKILDQEIPDRHVECHFNEYNISWTWKTNDVRMRDNKSAVFDALILAGVPRNGIDVSCAWNEKDGVYGKMDAANVLRPAAHLFHLFNAHCVGEVVAATTSHDKRVVAFAVKNGRERTLVLINRSPNVQPVRLGFGGWKPAHVASARIGKEGFSETKPSWSDIEADGLFLPDNSVTVLILSE